MQFSGTVLIQVIAHPTISNIHPSNKFLHAKYSCGNNLTNTKNHQNISRNSIGGWPILAETCGSINLNKLKGFFSHFQVYFKKISHPKHIHCVAFIFISTALGSRTHPIEFYIFFERCVETLLSLGCSCDFL